MQGRRESKKGFAGHTYIYLTGSSVAEQLTARLFLLLILSSAFGHRNIELE
jgi:hypothetical protein